jgi:hypothetical protein
MTSGNRMSGDLCLWALADAEHETRHVPTRMSALPGQAASRIIADLGIARVRNVRVGPPTRLRTRPRSAVATTALPRRVVDELEPGAVVDARLFGLRRLAEDRAEASEFHQQRVDIHWAETFR